jgi:hypothetical protein
MRLNLPVVLLSAFALVAPAAAVDAKDKGKDKNKDKKEQKADGRRGGNNDHRDGDHSGNHSGDRDGKITICHVPPGNPSNSKTLTVGESAWSAHSGHGDYRGACRPHGGQGNRFDRLDTNNDGVISSGEWVGDQTAFRRLDRDNSGSLSKEEFSRH